MKRRFIVPHEKRRVLIRGRCCEDLCTLAKGIKALGYEEVGLLKFLLHIALWWKKPKDAIAEE